MERQALYEKFTILSWQQQLGNLAATLAKISAAAVEPGLDTLTDNLLRESALMVEWSARNVPPEYHAELARIQRECLEWKKVFPADHTRNLLSLNSRHQSDRLLEISGSPDGQRDDPLSTAFRESEPIGKEPEPVE